MDFKTSQISLTSRVQDLCLKSHNGLTNNQVLNAVISRLAALLLSPASVIDLAIHTIALPFTTIYAIGKSFVLQKAEFNLPWQHLQRIRETAFPILFGTLFGLIHPYLGIYATEPNTKHIAGGYLLSNSTKNVDVVISPVSAFSETIDNIKRTPYGSRISPECQKLTENVLEWEKSLEKIQSLKMFDFKITYRIMGKIQGCIQNTALSPILKGILVRVALVVYPVFAALDLIAAAAVSALFLTTGIVKLIGGKTPAYLETTNSPVLHIYQIAKMILSGIGLIAGFGVSFISPKLGLDLSYPSSDKFGLIPLLLKLQFIKLSNQIKSLKDHEKMLLPIVIQGNNDIQSSDDILPSHSSHMTYLLIAKDNGKFSAELIERGLYHGAKYDLTELDVINLAKKCISLRFSSENKDLVILSTFDQKQGLINLGKQPASLSNCVITNLFAAYDVINNRNGVDPKNHQLIVQIFKMKTMDKYDYFKYDFFPFGTMDAIVEEIIKLEKTHI